MTTTTAHPARQRRHTVQTVTRARELHEAGWSVGRVVRLLKRELDIEVSEITVRRWVDPDFADQMRRWGRQHTRRQRHHTATFRFPGVRTSAWKHARMRALRDDAGLSAAAISRLMTFDFGEPISERTVRRVLADDANGARQ